MSRRARVIREEPTNDPSHVPPETGAVVEEDVPDVRAEVGTAVTEKTRVALTVNNVWDR